MNILHHIWGSGTDLTALQMGVRGVCTFLLALVLIRVSGRRSFGVRTALDNIIVILLGAILSRAVVGASPFIPVITTCFLIVLLHRLFGWLIFHSPQFGRLIEGDKIVLYKNGQFLKPNMEKALVCEEDIRQGVRESALTENLDKLDMIYMERNGQISVIEE